MIGRLARYNAERGFGFLEPVEPGDDVFVHVSALNEAGISDFLPGDKFEFDVVEGRNGKSQAANLRLVSRGYGR